MALGRRETVADESMWCRSRFGFMGLDQVSKCPVCAFPTIHIRVAVPYHTKMQDPITRRQGTISENQSVPQEGYQEPR